MPASNGHRDGHEDDPVEAALARELEADPAFRDALRRHRWQPPDPAPPTWRDLGSAAAMLILLLAVLALAARLQSRPLVLVDTAIFLGWSAVVARRRTRR